MKKINFNPSFIILICIFISCNENKQIVGKWKRIGDDLVGMQVEIVENNSNLKATIIHLADNDSLLPFAEGDVKWKEFIKTSDSTYDFKDLSKYQQTFGSIFENKYEDGYMIFKNDTIKTRSFSKGEEIVGTSQLWIKLKK
jgi:hypothetical protein